ncbi:Microtubule-associated protein MAP65/Ase1/PRC1 protein [Dioscorea alata]|uniref:Microtubule-associated protein MAP65/Ase1/PRC1 protein n=5 Tax=Dioscorea alata TaxID=55571 RepID=A0ACB7UJ52_DIOAL|nr:Microtubule-associated protein MAP65/Ase1/PRC1 protein [Dioscorea alata]KAH7660280.1 Microtubule-associated protein MAP65/Ase1/PRC1 protein [Dioscorea alata]KAH7660281.1 Microtubule-associated protein MAP65/Ase1/PRC1 protein [Dioscorea alata]KAH7660282.1 Microtubule-associated protein MAP65/Ase1/PRC1 protein [Dioscorea alata]KAH7660283.1 Microtubule-associated protein MAP65/Ase1/PRC1 protein [Dioscorea alata]
MGTQDPLSRETTCGSLLQQLQIIWDEVGESDDERDKMLLQLEQECLDVYRKKVDQASRSRAHLLQALADSKAEFARLLCSLGEKSVAGIPERSSGTIKEQLASIAPALEQLCKQKEQRIQEFADVQAQIQKINGEIAGNLKIGEHVGTPVVDEDDLSLKKLDEFHSQLLELQKEKSERLHNVLDFVSAIHDLCAVLGMDFFSTITEVHPSLDDSIGVQSKSISDNTLSMLSRTILSLKEDKKSRLQKLQELASQLCDLWNLMDTPEEEQSLFSHITCNISASVDDVTTPGALALDLIEQAEIEVERLDQLKGSKMKEIALKKQAELEDIYARAHVEIDTMAARENIVSLIESGNFEPSELLNDLDNKVSKAKEEALSRKEILEKVEKWMSACEEESWLEDYNRDENRYNSSRGAHLNLKRAEKARVLVNKIPALVDTLVAKTRTWEEDHGLAFTYDGVPLLAMLDEYTILRRDKEEEKRRMRDQKKFHEQLTTEQEAIFGSKPSPARSLGPKKAVGPRAGGGLPNGTPNRRLSLNTHNNSMNGGRSTARDGRRESARLAAPINYVAIAKEEAASYVSSNDPIPVSP